MTLGVSRWLQFTDGISAVGHNDRKFFIVPMPTYLSLILMFAVVSEDAINLLDRYRQASHLATIDRHRFHHCIMIQITI